MTVRQRSSRSAFLELARQFTKHILNHFTLTFAGRFLYSVVYHTGRRSGKVYRTPVVADATPDGFIMPLTYGADTDWCQNVLAAGESRIRKNGVTWRVDRPQVLDAAAAFPLLSAGRRRTYQRFGIEQYLTVRRVEKVAA